MANLPVVYSNHNSASELCFVNNIIINKYQQLSNLTLLRACRETPIVVCSSMFVPLFFCGFRETGKAVAVRNKPVWVSTGNIAWQLQ